MTDATEPLDRQPTSAADADLAAYRAVSKSAIVALVLGFASTLALVSKLGWLFPIPAVLTATFALWHISRNRTTLIGRKAALLGLAIALIIVAFGISRLFSREAMLIGQARHFASEWLELVSKHKLDEAHQLALPHSERQLPGTQLGRFYAIDDEARALRDAFFAEPPAKQMSSCTVQAEIRFERTSAHQTIAGKDYVDLIYRFRCSREGRAIDTPVRIVVQRSLHPVSAQGRWQVYHLGMGEGQPE